MATLVFTIEGPDELAEDTLTTFALANGWVEGGEETMLDRSKAAITRYILEKVVSFKKKEAELAAKIAVEQATAGIEQLATVTLELLP